MIALITAAELCAFSMVCSEKECPFKMPITSTVGCDEADSIVRKVYQNCMEATIRDDIYENCKARAERHAEVAEAGYYRMYMSLNRHFKMMWECDIEEILGDALMRREFSKFTVMMFGNSIGAVRMIHGDALSDHDIKEQYNELLDNYDDSNTRRDFKVWEAEKLKDPRARNMIWSEIFRKVKDSREHGFYTLNDGIYDHIAMFMSVSACFSNEGNRLKWDAGDCERVIQNLQEIIDTNRPCADAKWQSGMRAFREIVKSVQKMVGDIVMDDRDMQRCVEFTNASEEEVEKLANSLQRILTKRIYNMTGKHVSIEGSNAIEAAYEIGVRALEKGAVAYGAANCVASDMGRQGIQVNMYGLWRIIKEFEENGDERLQFMKSLYRKARANGGVISIEATGTEDTWEELRAEAVLQHAICNETHRIFTNELNCEGVYDRVSKQLDDCTIAKINAMIA